MWIVVQNGTTTMNQTQSWQITSLIKTGSRLGCGQAGQFPLPVVHKYNTFPFRLYFLCIEQKKGYRQSLRKKKVSKAIMNANRGNAFDKYSPALMTGKVQN